MNQTDLRSAEIDRLRVRDVALLTQARARNPKRPGKAPAIWSVLFGCQLPLKK
jgi:hypothetical protein